MKVVENIAGDLEQRIDDISIVNTSRSTILFFSWDPRVKKVMHNPAKRIGFTPSYSENYPIIKVELMNLVNRRIETELFKKITKTLNLSAVI
tara:strand:- start:67 stop:342 length:276 start_codon:yes stop_codon:yes gene_type:complete